MSPATVAAYKAGLECYLRYLADEHGADRAAVSFDWFRREHVKGWARWMAERRGNAPKTIELRLTAVTAFLSYAAQDDITLAATREEAASVKPPKAPRRPVEFLPTAATAAILAAHTGSTAKSRRNRMLLIFLYDTAARVSEVCGARLQDVRLGDAPFAVLRGKGGKTRNMPIMAPTADHLRVYLAEFHPSPDPAAPLFHSLKDGRAGALSPDTVSRVLKQAGDAARPACAEVPARLHCHLIRRTRAMDLYQDGVPLPLIMQMLGHESMSTTSAFYAFATQQMMADAVGKATPPALAQQPEWATDEILDALYAL
ncbi:MAG: site-specific integrase [Propionibacteriaceae bacterium]|jgi:site-specific recombinase XerD|nr:site-specific integrase [Propionibacteriaceae bacterium]